MFGLVTSSTDPGVVVSHRQWMEMLGSLSDEEGGMVARALSLWPLMEAEHFFDPA